MARGLITPYSTPVVVANGTTVVVVPTAVRVGSKVPTVNASSNGLPAAEPPAAPSSKASNASSALIISKLGPMLPKNPSYFRQSLLVD